MLLSPILGISILCFLIGTTKSAGQRNITIDDQFGDEMTRIIPTYTPSDRWNSGGIKLPPRVFAKPNPSLAHNETWHDLTHLFGKPKATVNFGFTGVSIYVYCIVANKPPPGPSFETFADYKFFLDGNNVGEYTHEAENTQSYFYDTPVYVNTTLENAYHNFSIVLDSTEQSALILFDYAVYTIIDANLVSTSVSSPNQPTFPPNVANMPSSGIIVGDTSMTLSTSSPDQPTASTPDVAGRPKLSSGAIVGSTLGAVTFLFCAGLLCLVVCRRRRMLRVYSNGRATTITHNPLLVLNSNTPAPSRIPSDAGRRHRDETIRELRQMIQDLRADKRAMRTALRMSASYAT